MPYRIEQFFKKRIRASIDEKFFTEIQKIFSSETEFYLICGDGKKIISFKKQVDNVLQTYFDEILKNYNTNSYITVTHREKLRAFLNSILKIRPEFFL